jgi:hypothetical protein
MRPHAIVAFVMLTMFTGCPGPSGRDDDPVAENDAGDSAPGGQDAGQVQQDVQDAGETAPQNDSGNPADAGGALLNDGGGAPDANLSQPPENNPASQGGFSFDRTETEITREGRTIPTVALFPGDAPLAALFFMPGFQVPALAYESLGAHLASHGYAVFLLDPPASLLDVNHRAMQEDAAAVLDWALSADGPLFGQTIAIGAFGHSLGAKVGLMWALVDNRVQALFSLDPVNGGHPVWGYSDERPDLRELGLDSLGIPLGFLGETTNGMASGLAQPCAPLAENFQTLFDEAQGAPLALEWEIPDADHMDFVSDPDACGFACGACEEGSADIDEVHRISRLLATAFFDHVLLNDGTSAAWLFGADLPDGLLLRKRP